MSARGGFRLYERGIGEASTTVYDRFDRWKSGFFAKLSQVCAFCQMRVLVSDLSPALDSNSQLTIQEHVQGQDSRYHRTSPNSSAKGCLPSEGTL
jgi:hypothetical protein